MVSMIVFLGFPVALPGRRAAPVCGVLFQRLRASALSTSHVTSDRSGSGAVSPDFVVIGLVGRKLADDLERVRSCQRVGQRAHDEVQPPRQLLARQVRQRAAERVLEARDHHGVLDG
jgi:hypothetical protein